MHLLISVIANSSTERKKSATPIKIYELLTFCAQVTICQMVKESLVGWDKAAKKYTGKKTCNVRLWSQGESVELTHVS